MADVRARWGVVARKSSSLHGVRIFLPRLADTNDQFQELKLRGDTDGANRRLAESRSPVLPMDARLDVAPVHYIPAKDERVIRESTRSSS